MKLNPLITESLVFSRDIETNELEKLKKILRINLHHKQSIKAILRSTDKKDNYTYVALFTEFGFSVIRYPDALRDPTDERFSSKNKTFDILSFPYSSIIGAAVTAPSADFSVNYCLFFEFTNKTELQFASADGNILYDILSLYNSSYIN